MVGGGDSGRESERVEIVIIGRRKKIEERDGCGDFLYSIV